MSPIDSSKSFLVNWVVQSVTRDKPCCSQVEMFYFTNVDDTLLGINCILMEQDVILLSKVHKEIRIKISETKQHMCMLVIAISRK